VIEFGRVPAVDLQQDVMGLKAGSGARTILSHSLNDNLPVIPIQRQPAGRVRLSFVITSPFSQIDGLSWKIERHLKPRKVSQSERTHVEPRKTEVLLGEWSDREAVQPASLSGKLSPDCHARK